MAKSGTAVAGLGPGPGTLFNEVLNGARDALASQPRSGFVALAVIHDSLPGRLRIRVAALRHSDDIRRTIEMGVGALNGVWEVSANTLSANVLIRHDGTRSPVEYLSRLKRLLEENGSPTPDAPAASARRPGGPPRVAAAAPGHAPVSERDWHAIEAKTLLVRLGASPGRGLTTHEASQRLARHGANALPAPQRRSRFQLVAAQFNSLPVVLLGVSAVVSVATGGILDAVVILAVVALNATIGYITEAGSERTIAALTAGTQRHALALRDGKAQTLPAEEVVPGDLLLLAPGSFVPADARILEAHAFTVDESVLTGESFPASKAAALLPRDIALADRRNMAHMGTTVTGGSARAVVVGTGLATEIGAIQSLVDVAEAPRTPMQRRLDRLGNQVVWMSLVICGGVFGLGLLRGLGLFPMLKASVSLAVAAVPEGLPTVATTTLALGLRAMRRRKVLIRHLGAVETLGAVQVICLDKTGTLTLNSMSVVTIHVGGKRYAGSEFAADMHARRAGAERERLLQVAVLCNEAGLEQSHSGVPLNGSSTENALVRMGIAAGVPIGAWREQMVTLRTDYRAEGRSYMRTVHADASGGRLMAVKGNPADVLALCDAVLLQGEPVALDDAGRAAILAENERMAADALRVLGFAYASGGPEIGHGPCRLTWLGLVGMADPVRPGVDELVQRFHRAGIRTVMLTGDQSTTAAAIARGLRLSYQEDDQPPQILDSVELERIDPGLMRAHAERVDVFARVSPANKLQIVRALQRAGSVVAMTGDGVNDGPALKAADIGVAMGSAGTDVARSVADVVLEDDNLETMIVAVEHGRTIYDNIHKSIHFLVTTNLSEIVLTLAAIGAGAGQPVNAMQMLWINLMSDVLPALALALEKPEPDVLRRPPRDSAQPFIERRDVPRLAAESLLLAGGGLGSLGVGLLRYGMGPRASTMAFMSLTLGQLLHAYACRSARSGLFTGEKLPANPWLHAAVGGSVAAQLLTTLAPGLRRLLGTTPLGGADWAVVAAGALGPLLVNEALKPRFTTASLPPDGRVAERRRGA